MLTRRHCEDSIIQQMLCHRFLLRGLYLKEKNSAFQRDIDTPLFIAEHIYVTYICHISFTIVNIFHTHTHTHTHTCYSAIKKSKILPFVTTWMEPEVVMLNEISRHRKASTT
jgi:hypothetical protein